MKNFPPTLPEGDFVIGGDEKSRQNEQIVPIPLVFKAEGFARISAHACLLSQLLRNSSTNSQGLESCTHNQPSLI